MEKICEEGGTLCSSRDTDDLLQNVPPNSANMLSIRNSNILMTSFSEQYIFPFVLCRTIGKDRQGEEHSCSHCDADDF
jgi:hypothetical protein